MATTLTTKKSKLRWAGEILGGIIALFLLLWLAGLGYSAIVRAWSQDNKPKQAAAATTQEGGLAYEVRELIAFLKGDRAEKDELKRKLADCEGSKKVVRTHKRSQPRPKAPTPPAPVVAQAPPPPVVAPVPQSTETVIVQTRVKTRVIIEEPVEEPPTYERREVVRPRPPVVVYGGGYEYGYVPPPPIYYENRGGSYCGPRYQSRTYGGHMREYRGGGHVYNPGGPRNPPTGTRGGPANPPLGGQRGGGPRNPPSGRR